MRSSQCKQALQEVNDSIMSMKDGGPHVQTRRGRSPQGQQDSALACSSWRGYGLTTTLQRNAKEGNNKREPWLAFGATGASRLSRKRRTGRRTWGAAKCRLGRRRLQSNVQQAVETDLVRERGRLLAQAETTKIYKTLVPSSKVVNSLAYPSCNRFEATCNDREGVLKRVSAT